MSTSWNQSALVIMVNNRIRHLTSKSTEKKSTLLTKSWTPAFQTPTMAMTTLFTGETSQVMRIHGNHGKKSRTPPPINHSDVNTKRIHNTNSPLRQLILLPRNQQLQQNNKFLSRSQKQSRLDHVLQQNNKSPSGNQKHLSGDHPGSEDFAFKGGAPVMNQCYHTSGKHLHLPKLVICILS